MQRLSHPLFRPTLLALSLLGLLGLPVGLAAATELTASGAEAQARVIVRFKSGAPSVRAKPLALRARAGEAADVAQQRAHALGLRAGLSGAAGLNARRSLDERTHVLTARGIDSATLARRLAEDGEVELVAIDHRRRHFATPNDSYYLAGPAAGPVAGQWYLRAPAGEVRSSINAPAAWDITTGSAAIVIAVLDTGIRKDHPDLAGQIVGGYDMVGLNAAAGLATANDGDRADADASDPGDWVSQADLDAGTLGAGCTREDIGSSSWHGTRVAGLAAAASNNGQGIAGVAWASKILPVRVLGKCGGYDSDIMAGMRWAAGISVPGLPANPNPARVLNLSLGGSGDCAASSSSGRLYREVIADVTAANAVVVAAAGNTAGLAVGLPGSCPGVITVAGLRHAGSKVGFSSLGPEVTLSAPGGNCVNITAGSACLYPMLSTTNAGTTTPVPADSSYTNGAASVGTSFSAPLVSGTVALMLAVRPTLTPAEVKSMLTSTVRSFVSSGASDGTGQCQAPTASEQLECYCTTSTCGAGMLDAAAAVTAAKPVPAPVPTPAPAPAPTPAPSSGGGASGLGWLLGLALASLALPGRPRRP